ncbi:hypothetical protein Poli38472_008338 [Pythium oligandrum]|uniref:O-GlcNAc transferase C-terminal domain-containing protein n=1 Tax=Pythium oligandrum TaxID=41045 RepID=A0A8K1CN62_PYTOL|nr:hypothetical protein Poli38472_008338 [Pythium oligandrum]|eukprot:TMW65696.1 hypothetical protein Poli38472_008338 [Pythium oligandrum]
MWRHLLLPLALWLTAAWVSEATEPLQARCHIVSPSNEAFPCYMAAFGEYVPHLEKKYKAVLPVPTAQNEADDLTACSEISKLATRGALVLVRRGGCTFQQKLVNVAAAGGNGMLVINTDDSALQLGTVEFESINAMALSTPRSYGDDLITRLSSADSPEDSVEIHVSSMISSYEQAWSRIKYLTSINAPLVAYDTFIEALPDAISTFDSVLEALVSRKSVYLAGVNDNDLSALLAFVVNCSSAFPDSWDATDDVRFIAATSAASIVTLLENQTQESKNEILLSASMRLLGRGYYAHAARLLSVVKTESSTCQLAFVRFLSGDLVSAVMAGRECRFRHIEINNTVDSLQIPNENFERLVALELSSEGKECLDRLGPYQTSDVNSSGRPARLCCRRRIASHDDDLGSISPRNRLVYTFQSTFVEELYHTLNIMGVFMDELGAFDESLAFFDGISRLCEDWSLTNEVRKATAVPIVFKSSEAISTFREQLEISLGSLIQNHKTKKRMFSSATGSELYGGYLSRPEESSYLRYTITPPTMFVGYQGDDVFALQRSLYATRSTLFPSSNAVFSSSVPEVTPFHTPKRRVAFISSWFRNHSVGKLLLGVIKRLDRRQFHVMVYRTVHFLRHSDDLTAEFHKEADSYLELPANLDAALALLRHEKLDVVIYPELGMDAWTVFLSHHRIAPTQCVFWGHPITTGNPAIDYFISSEYFISDFFERDPSKPKEAPSEDDRRWPGAYHSSTFSEQVVLFRGLSTFFTQPKPFRNKAAFTRAMLRLPENRRLYVCPQTLMKLHPAFDEVLSGILTKDPKALIILLSSPSQVVWKEKLRRRFRQSFGKAHHRILFFSTLPYQEFMGLLSLADVILDPFPFGGGVTTLDALAVGTPVVTQPSAQTVMQLAAGFLRYMNVTDTIVSTVDEYITLAIRIAQDAGCRQNLQRRIETHRHTIYEDELTLEDWNTFLASI